jgi:protein-disulfide isomerase
MTAARRDMKLFNLAIIALAVVFTLTLGGRVVWAHLRLPPVVEHWQQAVAGGTPLGDTTAALRMVVFSDFECPHCARAHPLLERVANRYAGRLTVVLRHLPLHAHSFAAAVAAECAASQGRFAALASALYRQQDSIGVRSWMSYALDAALPDTAAFASCVSHARTKARVDSDVALARAVGAAGTPTVLLGGRLFKGVPDETRLDQLIEDMLTR